MSDRGPRQHVLICSDLLCDLVLVLVLLLIGQSRSRLSRAVSRKINNKTIFPRECTYNEETPAELRKNLEMEIHHRFMTLPTTGVNIIETLASNRESEKKSSMILELIKAYTKKIIIDHVFDMKTLETYRMILCYEYQLLVNTISNVDDPLEYTSPLNPADLASFFILNNDNKRTREEQSMLYDIEVLQFALCSDKRFLLMNFEVFCAALRVCPGNKSKHLVIKVLECFADSYNLQMYLYKYKDKDDPEELEGPFALILAIIKSRMEQQEGKEEWKLLASLLPKLAITFGPQKIVPSLWQLVIGCKKTESDFRCKASMEIIDLDKKLAALCILADACFPSETERVREFHLEQCVQNEFWFILNQGLVSLASQERKQALYLFKRAIDFSETHKPEITKRLELMKNSHMPFVRYQPEADALSVAEAKQHFFLILEVSEEKQKHLVLPALSYLPSLAKFLANDVRCTCSSPVWLGCVLRRVVRHDNESVKIFGLRQILNCDDSSFIDKAFISFFIAELNNTYLYEYDVEAEKKPLIVDKLEDFFLRLLYENEDLMTTIVGSISSISWGPVAIYWILQALLAAFKRSEINKNECKWLPFLGELIQKSLMRHNLQLRTSSQVLLTRVLREMPLYPSCLHSILDILTSFPDNENLKPFSPEWYQIADYLLNNIDSLSAQEYIARRCEKLLNPDQASRSVALLMESKLIFNVKPCRAETTIENLLQNLVGADLRPYADQDAIFKVLELSGHLMSHASKNDNTATDKIKTLMSTYVDDIIKVVNRSLERKTILAYDEYLIVISGLIGSTGWSNWPNVEKELERFEDKCIHIIGNPENFGRNQWSYAVKVLYLCREKTIVNRPVLGKVYIPPLLRYFRNQVLEHSQRGLAAQTKDDPKGNFATDCFGTIAKLVHQFIANAPFDLWPTKIPWFQELLTLVETGNEDVIGPVASTVYELIVNIPLLAIQDLDTVNSIIRLLWQNVWQLNKTPVFFSALEKLTRLIVSEHFLKTPGAEEIAVQWVEKLMEEGENVPKLKKIFLTAMRELKSDYVLQFRKVFTSCLLHGSVPRRDQRIELAAIEHSRRFDALDYFSISELSIDNTVRAYAVIILVEKIEISRAAQFGEDVCNDLLEILKKHKNKRYFDNSQLHRLKHRIMQTLLVVHHILDQKSKQNLHDSLCDLLIAESNQPSVRLMYEWLLIGLHVDNADMRETIWTRFATAIEKRPGSVVSLASVIFHVARLLPEPSRQAEYIEKGILVLLPNCMGQQFNVRLYSQTILVKIYEMLSAVSLEAETYAEIYDVTQKSICRGNLMKNSSKVLDHFYFSIFNPTLDYNIRTIYYDLPRLTNVAFDECIRPEVFKCDELFTEYLIIDKKGEALLAAAKPSDQTPRATGELADVSMDVEFCDIQKKIIPWKTMVPIYDDLSEISKAKLMRRKIQNEEAGIIVVASLIDRPPNLGGLARTCEIFGAKELVIGSQRYAEDREFQALSVSAEKWITITEVKPHLLQNYLLEKQSEGWELVGAEQTAKSTNLLEMVFPKKTILLLGNEKDGIPANLIPLLDTCVEIPQNGVVRSLNVHVTGAICIWQYAIQHVLT